MTSFSRTHPQLFGFAVTFAGVAFFFPDALVIRLVGVDTMTVAVWRGLFAGLVTLIGLALFAPSAFRDWRILASGPGAAIMAVLAVLSAGLGVGVERWLFFAEAKHTVTLYYGATDV